MTNAISPLNLVRRPDRRRRAGTVRMEQPFPALSPAFTQASIAQVYPPQYRGGMVYLSWQSIAPVGTWFQVYLNDQLAWAGQQTSISLPVPSDTVRIDIGSVGPGLEWTSFASQLPAAPLRRALLTWTGGTFEGTDLAGFYVYGPDQPYGPVDYTTPLTTITAYPGGILTGSSGTYSWTSGDLDSGVWTFAVIPFDQAGNNGPAQTVDVTICTPPNEPAVFPGTQIRLQYTYSRVTQEAMLNWNASSR